MRLSTKAAFCSMWLLSCTVWSCGEYEEIALANGETVPTGAHLEVSYLDSECRLVGRWSAPVSKLPVRLKVIASPIEAEGGRRIIALRSSVVPHQNLVESPADSTHSTPKAITLKLVAPMIGKRALEGVNTDAGVSNHFSVYVNPRDKEKRWMIAGLQQSGGTPNFIIATSENELMQLANFGSPIIKSFSIYSHKDTIASIYSDQSSMYYVSCSRANECKVNTQMEKILDSSMNLPFLIDTVSSLTPPKESDGRRLVIWTEKQPNSQYQLFSSQLPSSAAPLMKNSALNAKSIFGIVAGTIQQKESPALFVGLKEINGNSVIKKFSMKTEGPAPAHPGSAWVDRVGSRERSPR